MFPIVIDIADHGGKIGKHAIETMLQDSDLIEGAILHGTGQISLLYSRQGLTQIPDRPGEQPGQHGNHHKKNYELNGGLPNRGNDIRSETIVQFDQHRRRHLMLFGNVDQLLEFGIAFPAIHHDRNHGHHKKSELEFPLDT